MRAFLTFILAFGLIHCQSPQEASNVAEDSVKESSLEGQEEVEEQSEDQAEPESSLAGKSYSLGINLEDCDGSTYSEYSVMLNFIDDQKVTRVREEAMNIGGPDYYIKITSFSGTYRVEGEIIEINFDHQQETKRKDETVLEDTEKDIEEVFSLMMAECQDGRSQLLSNMPGKNAAGDSRVENDDTSWVIVSKE